MITTPPSLIIGGAGSGKTTVSRRIQEAVNVSYIAYIQHDDIPVCDSAIHTCAITTLHVEPAPISLVEGILNFGSPKLRRRMDSRIFVDTHADIRFIRRLHRNISERGRSLDAIVKQYMTTVRPMHMEFVEPSKRYAHGIVPRGGDSRVAMAISAARIQALLQG